MSCSRKKRMTEKQLYEANHLCLMIAFTSGNSRNMPPQHLISRKDDPSYYHARKFQFAPLDGAHYANFSCILNQNEQKKTIQKYNGIMSTRHKLSVSKNVFKPIAPKPLLFSFLLRNQNKRIQILTVLTQFARQMVRMPAFFLEAIITI